MRKNEREEKKNKVMREEREKRKEQKKNIKHLYHLCPYALIFESVLFTHAKYFGIYNTS